MLKINDELHIQTVSFDTDHLSHAIDLMRLARNPSTLTEKIMGGVLRRRFAISSIIHAFSGLESVINLFGFELFFNSDSQRHFPPEQRDFLLSRMIKTWDNVPSIDKLSFILSHSGRLTLPPKLENQLRELNNLRNWLVHGFSYKRTLLLEPSPDRSNTYNVVDMEDSVDWAKKFPNTKFKHLERLDAEDAQLALSIVFNALKMLSDCMSQPLAMLTCVPEFKYTILHGDSFNEKVEELLYMQDVNAAEPHT